MSQIQFCRRNTVLMIGLWILYYCYKHGVMVLYGGFLKSFLLNYSIFHVKMDAVFVIDPILNSKWDKSLCSLLSFKVCIGLREGNWQWIMLKCFNTRINVRMYEMSSTSNKSITNNISHVKFHYLLKQTCTVYSKVACVTNCPQIKALHYWFSQE